MGELEKRKGGKGGGGGGGGGGGEEEGEEGELPLSSIRGKALAIPISELHLEKRELIS